MMGKLGGDPALQVSSQRWRRSCLQRRESVEELLLLLGEVGLLSGVVVVTVGFVVCCKLGFGDVVCHGNACYGRASEWSIWNMNAEGMVSEMCRGLVKMLSWVTIVFDRS